MPQSTETLRPTAVADVAGPGEPAEESAMY